MIFVLLFCILMIKTFYQSLHLALDCELQPAEQSKGVCDRIAPVSLFSSIVTEQCRNTHQRGVFSVNSFLIFPQLHYFSLVFFLYRVPPFKMKYLWFIWTSFVWIRNRNSTTNSDPRICSAFWPNTKGNRKEQERRRYIQPLYQR